ncbi:MAG: GAF domain-containing protein [Caldilineales bacterium]|nr:GAF domain-containing protein [Caldilineales bacterium]MDW8319335.1 GAF domain-containing protein [Anaerolineae bacterium]
MASLYELAFAISGLKEREALLQHLYQQVALLFRCDGFLVALCQDPPQHDYEIALAIEAGDVVAALQGQRIPLDQGGLTAFVLQTRQPLLVHDLETEPLPAVPRHVGRPARAWLAAPLLAQGRLLGAVALQSFRPAAFDQEDLRLLEAMVRQVSVALENGRLFHETQRRDAILAGLADISQLLLAPADLHQALPEVLARLGRAACVSRCYIFENQRAPDGALLMIQRYRWVMPGAPPEVENLQWQSLPYAASGLGRWAQQLSAGQPIHGPVAHFPPAERVILEAHGIRSIAVVPIVSDRAWWGFLGFDDCVGERAWSAAELEALKSAAAVLGAALARQRAEEAERKQRLLAETLRDTALALTHTVGLEELLDQVLANAQRLVPSDAASIFLVEGEVARVVRTRGYAERGLDEIARSMVFRIAENYNLAAMVATRQPMLIRDVKAINGWQDLPTSRWIGSYLGAPIVVDGEVAAFLNLDFAERDAVPPDGPRLLQAFAAQAGAALANARLYQALEAQVARTRQLVLNLMHAQELERQAVARQLHDDMGQALTALLLNLGSLERSLAGRAEVRDLERLAEARWLAEQTVGRTRMLSLDLHPPALDDLGLVPAIRWYLEQLARRSGLTVSFRVHGAEQPLSPAVALAVYRILQEATTNVSRHARAGRLDVKLHCTPEALHLQIRDDGQGFDVSAFDAAGGLRRGSGLLSMRERAAALGGECLVSSEPGRGTLVDLRIPLEPTVAAAPIRWNG